MRKIDDDELTRSNTESVKLMKLIANSEIEDWNPYQTEVYAAIAVLFFMMSIACVVLGYGIGFEGRENAYHKEIIPSKALSYIDDGQLIALPNGNYPVAMPSGDEWLTINGARKFPLLMVMVPTADGQLKLYPLNIEDDSFLPRQGRTLALNILIGFTSAHAENRLQYDEKHGNVEDYKRKAYYYLEVRSGAGRMKRGYKQSRSTDPIKEMQTVYKLTNGGR